MTPTPTQLEESPAAAVAPELQNLRAVATGEVLAGAPVRVALPGTVTAVQPAGRMSLAEFNAMKKRA